MTTHDFKSCRADISKARSSLEAIEDILHEIKQEKVAKQLRKAINILYDIEVPQRIKYEEL